MGYREFTAVEYRALRNQHNIMVLVGNGFDIQVTRRYESRFSPRYPAFYHYLASRDFDSSNLVVRQMAAAKENGEENWSDIEAAIGRLIRLDGGWQQVKTVYESTLAIQAAFSEFLELVAPPDAELATPRTGDRRGLQLVRFSSSGWMQNDSVRPVARLSLMRY